MKEERPHPRVGAPPGLTVHWLRLELCGEFNKTYRLNYNRKYHNYFYARYRKRTMIDCFTVIRTSKRCYRVTYFNADYMHFQYFSAENYRDCAAKMIEIYEVFKRLELAAEEREKNAETPENGENGEK